MTPRFLGARVDGGYSDYVIVAEPKYLFDYTGVPTNLACTYACAGLTAYSALNKVAPLTERDHLVIIGAGGVGMSALHLAAAVTPAQVIVADIDPTKRSAARQAGATDTIDNGADDAIKRALDITGGGAAATIDFVGAPVTTGFGLEILRKGGIHVVVGLYGDALPLSLPMLPFKVLTLRGSYVGSVAEMAALMDLVRSGKVPPIPIHPRPLPEANQALDDLRQGRVLGRTVLNP